MYYEHSHIMPIIMKRGIFPTRSLFPSDTFMNISVLVEAMHWTDKTYVCLHFFFFHSLLCEWTCRCALIEIIGSCTSFVRVCVYVDVWNAISVRLSHTINQNLMTTKFGNSLRTVLTIWLYSIHCRAPMNETMKIIEIAYIDDSFRMSGNTSGGSTNRNEQKKTATGIRLRWYMVVCILSFDAAFIRNGLCWHTRRMVIIWGD